MRNRIAIALAIAAGAGAAATANAAVVAGWTFETSIPATAGPFAPEVGAGAATGFHATASTYSSPVGNGSVHSFSSNTWAIGDYYQFSTSTTGYTGITVSWDQTSSNTGPRDFGISWSLTGLSGSFTQIGGTNTVLANATPNVPWSSATYNPAYTFNATGPASLDNQATVYFRLTMLTTASANGGTVAAGGTDRVDNFTINAVPAPGAVALLGVGGLIATRRRRA